jgi:hypothetical protein
MSGIEQRPFQLGVLQRQGVKILNAVWILTSHEKNNIYNLLKKV